MNSNIEVGQVLWLKVKYQEDVVSENKHPMLVAKIKNDYIEIIALDKTAGKLHQLFYNYNFYINSENPHEFVIYEDSYAQLNTKITIENIDELKKARKCNDKLSHKKLNDLLFEYRNYQKNYVIEEKRVVYMAKEEILYLNPYIKSN